MSTEPITDSKHLPGFSLGMDCPEPFEVDADAAERAAWAGGLDALAATPVLAHIDRSATIPVLGSDQFGPFMAGLEAHDTAWLAIRDVTVLVERGTVDLDGNEVTPDQYETHDVLVIRFDRDDANPADVIEPGNIAHCNFGYTDPIHLLAASALEFCDYFYWANETGLVGYRISVAYPPGHMGPADSNAVNIDRADPSRLVQPID